MPAFKNFIIIDDDPSNNFLCSIIIKNVAKESVITEFTDAVQALSYLTSEQFVSDSTNDTILFLDINMPIMNGWEFLEAFQNIDASIKDKIHIYILTSSIDFKDQDKAKSIDIIRDFVSKPLTKGTVYNIVAELR